ncbi:MAG TPA: DapH/DapD/GlmU-related protein [Ktedonobacterales bacterium]|nr:DapH/DapD/GlmU-related protein [Ktedonobacterales bacterium]
MALVEQEGQRFKRPVPVGSQASANAISIARTRLTVLALRLREDSLARNSVAIMGVTVVTAGLGYVYWLIAVHTYSPQEVGLASALVSIMTLTSTLTLCGVGSTLAQLLPRRAAGAEWSRTLNAALAVVTVTGLLGGTVVALALPHWSRQFAAGDWPALALALIAGVTLWNLATALDQLFIAERHARYTLARNATFAALKIPLLVAPLLLMRAGALSIFASWALAAGATTLWAAARFIPRLGRAYRPTTRGLVGEARGMFSSLAAQHLINIGGQTPMYLLPVFVTVRLSATANAYFYSTWMVGSLFFMISSSVATALFAEGSHERGALRRKARSSALLILALLGPMMLAFLFGGHYILALFGANYAHYGEPLLLLLVCSAIFDAITNIAVSMFRVQHKLYYAGTLNLGMATVTLALAWVLLPRLGLVGAGWAWLLGEAVGAVAVGVYAVVALWPRATSARPVSQSQLTGALSARLRSGLLTGRWLASRLTLRDALALSRYVALRVQRPTLRCGLFFLDHGSYVEVGPDAELRVGRGVRFMRDCSLHLHGAVSIGDDVFFNRGCYVAAHAKVSIGAHCLIGEYASIHDENHVIGVDTSPIGSRGFVSKPIVIGDNVWIGAKATILPGVHIGDNAVIGANAVVTHDIPAHAVAVGIPARVVKMQRVSSALTEKQPSSVRE